MQDTRHVLVPPERLAGWVQRFGVRNGAFTVESEGAAVVLRASNGCVAQLTAPPASTGKVELRSNAGAGLPPAESVVNAFVSAAATSVTVGLLLIRRGGYAVGVSREGVLLASKTGTRYVQSRTAAGGWSQQRFARRRANQADALVESTVERAVAIFGEHQLDSIQPGGDAQLVSDCLSHGRLGRYRELPVLPLLSVPDPRLNVLRETAADTRSVRIRLTGIPGS